MNHDGENSMGELSKLINIGKELEKQLYTVGVNTFLYKK
jgi:predicted flap endonuclease-1-like 5' DNA nuclease